MTSDAMVNTPVDVNQIFDALEKWIKQRPGLDFVNYGDIRSYRTEIREIGKQKKRAMRALVDARRSETQDAALLLDSFRAYSGRLEWKDGRLEYTTGQYWPTEYRNAAASVLETYISTLAQKWASEHPQKFQFRTMADVKAANKAIGNHWFDKGTMRFFNTRVETGLLTRASSGRQFFITSEAMDENHRRAYTVREALEDGTIDTVGEFQGYRTLEDARMAVRDIA